MRTWLPATILLTLLAAPAWAADVHAPAVAQEHTLVAVKAVDLAEGDRPVWLIQSVIMTQGQPRIRYVDGIVPEDDPSAIVFTGPPGYYSVTLFVDSSRRPIPAEVEIVATSPPPPTPDPDPKPPPPGPDPNPDPEPPPPPDPTVPDRFGMADYVKQDFERRYQANERRAPFAQSLADGVFAKLIAEIDTGKYPGVNAVFVDAKRFTQDFYAQWPGLSAFDWNDKLESLPIATLDDLRQALAEIEAGLRRVQ